ncbi:slit homolog 3 protein-like [Lytechinus variegatus]|uniref:slit homolog 3 protein-like n=1 Tax=Lytechinus variegatus TaxID=7654 RepID=UPI001BB1FA08|nr:slit homolog 3 protein-like [Lytechinus variegatus]
MMALYQTLQVIFMLLHGLLVGVRVDAGMDDINTRLNHTCSLNLTEHSANCSYRDLPSIPQNLPHDIRSLNVSDNNISALLDTSFTNYSLIHTLDCSYNSIDFIHNKTFHGLTYLKILMLQYNKIGFLPISLLDENIHISWLIFHHNRLTEISPVFRQSIHSVGEDGDVGCKNVSRFDLSFNRITAVEKEDFEGVQDCYIDSFYLIANRIKSLPRGVFTYLPAVNLLINRIELHEFITSSFIGNKAIVKATITGSGIRSIIPMNISNIPNNILPGVNKLYLQSNKLSTIPSYALRGFEHLQILDIGSNRITSVHEDSFCGLKSLVSLRLAVNKIKTLPCNSFACAQKLERIDLSHNNFLELDPSWFNGSQRLRTLIVYKSNIKDIHPVPWNVSNLQSLTLSNNDVRSINRNSFIGLSSLRVLDLTRNREPLDISLDAFEQNYNLERIIMEDLIKITLNGCFSNMHRLNFLDLSYSASRLDISSRDQFKNTWALRTLNLSRTYLQTEDLVQFKSRVPSFSGLVSLVILNIQHNHFNDFHSAPYAFTPLYNLQELDLTDCRIERIDSRMFRNLSSLRKLSLAVNYLKDIPEESFHDLTNLRILRLEFNAVAVIGKHLFSRTSHLKLLSVKNNQISTIDPFTVFPINLQTLVIANNPLTCTCQLAWFREWIEKVNVDFYQKNDTRCSSTSLGTLNNQTLWSFNPKDYCGVDVYLIVGVSLAVVTVLSVGILVYVKRWWLNYKMFLLKLAIVGYQEFIEDRTADDYEYQLNLMFHEDNEEWVNDSMKPFLEERMPHLEHIVFGDRDLHPGFFYLDAICDVIENSHKTVLLLSNQSVKDPWFMTKLRMSVEHMNDTKLEKVILIFLEDIENDRLPYLVRLLLSRNKPYLLWVDDDEDGQELFWAKFQKSLKANREMNNVIPV